MPEGPQVEYLKRWLERRVIAAKSPLAVQSDLLKLNAENHNEDSVDFSMVVMANVRRRGKLLRFEFLDGRRCPSSPLSPLCIKPPACAVLFVHFGLGGSATSEDEEGKKESLIHSYRPPPTNGNLMLTWVSRGMEMERPASMSSSDTHTLNHRVRFHHGTGAQCELGESGPLAKAWEDMSCDVHTTPTLTIVNDILAKGGNKNLETIFTDQRIVAGMGKHYREQVFQVFHSDRACKSGVELLDRKRITGKSKGARTPTKYLNRLIDIAKDLFEVHLAVSPEPAAAVEGHSSFRALLISNVTSTADPDAADRLSETQH